MLGMVNTGTKKDAARMQGRSQTVEVLHHARECGHYCLVRKEEPWKGRNDKISVMF